MTKALSQKKFNTMTNQQIVVQVQLKVGFDENQYTVDQIRKSNHEWSKGKVFGCPIRVKSMQDVEQILSELAISYDRIVISKFDMSFLSTPVKMHFKQDHLKTAKCPADLIFLQCVALNRLD